jgi:hypothetical protein
MEADSLSVCISRQMAWSSDGGVNISFNGNTIVHSSGWDCGINHIVCISINTCNIEIRYAIIVAFSLAREPLNSETKFQ